MRIEIRSDVFDGSNFMEVNHLISLLTFYQRYSVFVDVSAVSKSNLYKRLDMDYRSLIDESFNSIINSSADDNIAYYITDDAIKQNEFGRCEAISFFSQPVSIILENSLNDAYFVKALIKHFDSELILVKHIARKWMEFENAGGCTNVRNYILGKCDAYNNWPKNEKYVYLRCFVLLDSDRENPDMPLEGKHKEIIEFLKENHVSYHVLEKRAMENYLPDKAIEDFDQSENWFYAYSHLTPIQKDYFNISVGFSKKNANGTPKYLRRDLQEQTQKLFDNLSVTNYDILNNGLKIANFKTEYPRAFVDHHSVYKATLLEKTSHQENPRELLDIIDKIKKLI